jgi:cytochrome b subunit of formate dehydrogenase
MSETMVRFGRRARAEHVVIMVLFTLLALSGIPQKFYPDPWAETVIGLMGGIDRARWIHRFCGIAFALLALEHLAVVVVGALLGRVSLAMVPRMQDVRDAWRTLEHQLGFAPEGARFDRYDYRQKFEYWGLVFGGAVMIVTGFALYLPTLAARVVGGQAIPAAKVAHSNEGLMALLVILTWHIFSAHLSPDVFPFDRSIFEGTISLERMRHEHPLEYERLGSPEPATPFRRAAAILVLAPIRGAVFAMFLPLAGFLVLGRRLFAKLQRHARAQRQRAPAL